jgi:shikimate kinase
VIVERLRNEKNRPLQGLNDELKEQIITEILDAREFFYAVAKAKAIKTDGKTPEEVAEGIVKMR